MGNSKTIVVSNSNISTNNIDFDELGIIRFDIIKEIKSNDINDGSFLPKSEEYHKVFDLDSLCDINLVLYTDRIMFGNLYNENTEYGYLELERGFNTTTLRLKSDVVSLDVLVETKKFCAYLLSKKYTYFSDSMYYDPTIQKIEKVKNSIIEFYNKFEISDKSIDDVDKLHTFYESSLYYIDGIERKVNYVPTNYDELENLNEYVDILKQQKEGKHISCLYPFLIPNLYILNNKLYKERAIELLEYTLNENIDIHKYFNFCENIAEPTIKLDIYDDLMGVFNNIVRLNKIFK